MPPVFSKLTSFFPPVITDREKANNARNLARINMRSDERVEDSIEPRLACLKNLNYKRQEYWEELMLYEEPETVEEISSGGDLVIATFEEPDSDLDD